MLLPEWVKELEKAERWAPITLPEYKKAGAAKFVWLRSSNFEPDLNGYSSNHGGFAYIGRLQVKATTGRACHTIA